MANFVEVDTVRLNSDNNTVNEMIEAVKRELGNIYTEVDAMNRMWDGTANDLFTQAFASDRELFNVICEEGKALVSSIQTAKAEYEKCEAQVDSVISAISI